MSRGAPNTETEDYAAAVSRAIKSKKRVPVRKAGKKVAAVIPIEDLELLEQLEDRLDILEALEAIVEADREGGTIPWEQFEAQLKKQ